jgi:hypothetical protein
MFSSVWAWIVVAAAAVTVLGSLRWVLADFLLDEFGSLRDSLTRGGQPDSSLGGGVELEQPEANYSSESQWIVWPDAAGAAEWAGGALDFDWPEVATRYEDVARRDGLR